MAPGGPVHWVAYKGTTFIRTYTLYDDEAETQLTNLTGFSAVQDFFRLEGQATPDLTLTESDGMTLGGTAGTIVWEKVITLDPGLYRWELILTDASARVLEPLVRGVLEVKLTGTLQ